jgi:ATP-dependent DNA helicase RecG
MALKQDVPQILENFNLMIDGKINNAAIVLFGTKFMPYYPQCQLKLARFKGVNRREFLDSDLIYGNLFTLLDKAMLFVKLHLPTASRVVPGQIQRVDTHFIPLDAVREAIINALCHSDYSVTGGSIGLAIYDDRMEIFNRGGLLPGVTLEKLKSGFSALRNPLIAEVCYKSNSIEKWGRGIHDIIQYCLNVGDPEPEFQVDQVEFKVIFKFPKSLNPQVSIDKTNDAYKELSPRQQEIVNILSAKNQALSAKEILELLANPPPYRTLGYDLAVLKELGIIDLQGQARKSAWVYIGSK